MHRGHHVRMYHNDVYRRTDHYAYCIHVSISFGDITALTEVIYQTSQEKRLEYSTNHNIQYKTVSGFILRDISGGRCFRSSPKLCLTINKIFFISFKKWQNIFKIDQDVVEIIYQTLKFIVFIK